MAWNFKLEVNGYDFIFVNLDSKNAFGIIVPPDADLDDEQYIYALQEAQNYCVPLDQETDLEEVAYYWYKDGDYRQFVDRTDTVSKIHKFMEQKLLVVHDWVHKLLDDVLNDTPPIIRPNSKKPPKDESGYVYLLKSENGHYKIGKAKNPDNRLKTFTVKLPFKVEYVCTIQTVDMRELEQALHEQFAAKRIDGEWFDLATEDIEYIKEMAS